RRRPACARGRLGARAAWGDGRDRRRAPAAARGRMAASREAGARRDGAARARRERRRERRRVGQAAGAAAAHATSDGELVTAVRVGFLSTARINDLLLADARGLDDVEVAAVASRDLARAEAYAADRGIERAHGTYG